MTLKHPRDDIPPCPIPKVFATNRLLVVSAGVMVSGVPANAARIRTDRRAALDLFLGESYRIHGVFLHDQLFLCTTTSYPRRKDDTSGEPMNDTTVAGLPYCIGWPRLLVEKVVLLQRAVRWRSKVLRTERVQNELN